MTKRTHRPRVSRERVLETALALVDRDGLEGLSMRKLGAELQIEAMTLYYYFPNKGAILDGLIERMTLSSLEGITDRPVAWQDWLRVLAIVFRRELLLHPRLVPLIATRPVLTPTSMLAVEKMVDVLCTAGFSPLRAFQVLNIVTTFVVGHTLAEAGDTPGHEDAAPDLAGLGDQINPDELPHFSQAILHGLGQPSEHEARFNLALDVLVTGLTVVCSGELGQV